MSGTICEYSMDQEYHVGKGRSARKEIFGHCVSKMLEDDIEHMVDTDERGNIVPGIERYGFIVDNFSLFYGIVERGITVGCP